MNATYKLSEVLAHCQTNESIDLKNVVSYMLVRSHFHAIVATVA